MRALKKRTPTRFFFLFFLEEICFFLLERFDFRNSRIISSFIDFYDYIKFTDVNKGKFEKFKFS